MVVEAVDPDPDLLDDFEDRLEGTFAFLPLPTLLSLLMWLPQLLITEKVEEVNEAAADEEIKEVVVAIGSVEPDSA